MEDFCCFIFKGKKRMICSNLEMNHLPLWFALLSKFKHFEISTSFLMVPMQWPFVASTLRKCQNQNGRLPDAWIVARRLHRHHSSDGFMKIPFCLPDHKLTCQPPSPPSSALGGLHHVDTPPSPPAPISRLYCHGEEPSAERCSTSCRWGFSFLAAPNVFFLTRANGSWGFT